MSGAVFKSIKVHSIFISSQTKKPRPFRILCYRVSKKASCQREPTLIVKSDQRQISPYTITTESNIRVTRKKKMITNQKKKDFDC